MSFTLDERLTQGTVTIADWPLCQVLLKNEKNYPWVLLVPKRADIKEIYQLSQNDQQQLTVEIDKLSGIVQQQFTPDKLNVAAIGNMVPQLHIHIVGRFQTDPLWPASIWQPAYVPVKYTDEEFIRLYSTLQMKCQKQNGDS